MTPLQQCGEEFVHSAIPNNRAIEQWNKEWEIGHTQCRWSARRDPHSNTTSWKTHSRVDLLRISLGSEHEFHALRASSNYSMEQGRIPKSVLWQNRNPWKGV